MKATDFTNIASSLTAILTLIAGVMSQVLNCKPVADLTAVCEAAFLSPYWAGIAALGFAALTLLLKLLRPGGPLASLFGVTAVVVPPAKAGPGTVTPAQVAEK